MEHLLKHCYGRHLRKGVGIVPSKRIVEDAEELLLQDAVMVSCNEPKYEHWTLLAVLPKKKLVLYLDSLAADVVTPTSYRTVSKMASLIKELDKSTDTTQLQFVVTKDDIKQMDMTAEFSLVYTPVAL